MTAAELSGLDRVNTALEQLWRHHAQAIRQPSGIERCQLLAQLAEVEAACWEEVIERSPVRVQWRAALLAREHALQAARCWRRRARTHQQLSHPTGRGR